MHVEIAMVALFSVASAVALVARRFKAPYTVALVVAGLVLGTAHAFEAPHLTQELLYAVFLPGLIFEAAFAIELKKFVANKLAISALALPGLVAAIVLTAVLLVPVVGSLHLAEEFHVVQGLVFAAVIAATDPIAVVGLFKSLGAPKRLAVLIEGESLLNDGTAVVVFTIIVGIAMGQPFSVSSAALDFVRIVGMGVIVGLAIGYAVSVVIHKVDDPMIEITLTTIAAYGSFVAAEYFHFSGVIATVCAGMLCGNYAARSGMSASTRVAVLTFWEYLAFALNSLVFLLIGFEVRLDALLDAWQPIVIAWLAMTTGRAVVVYATAFGLAHTREAIPHRWSAVLTWGGLRGGLSMVLVLGLPGAMPHRALIQTMTFGVVVLSILVQGLTMGPLLRRLGLVGAGPGEGEYDRLRGAARAATAALDELAKMQREGSLHATVADELKTQFQQRLDDANAAAAALHIEKESLAQAERRSALRRALTAEKDALIDAHRAGRLSTDALEALLADVDARLMQVMLHDER